MKLWRRVVCVFAGCLGGAFLIAATVACGDGGAEVGSARLEQAGEIWDAKCAACHGPAGGGGVGPDLTDSHWVHGGSVEDIRRSIAKGFPMKGMIAYETELSPEEIDALVAYVLELEGTDSGDAYPPQGEPVGEAP